MRKKTITRRWVALSLIGRYMFHMSAVQCCLTQTGSMKRADEIEEWSGSEEWDDWAMSLQSLSPPPLLVGLDLPVWDYPLLFMRAGCLTQHCTTPPSTGRGRTPFSPAPRCGHCSGGTERLENLLSIFLFRHLTLLLTDYAVLDFSFWSNSMAASHVSLGHPRIHCVKLIWGWLSQGQC